MWRQQAIGGEYVEDVAWECRRHEGRLLGRQFVAAIAHDSVLVFGGAKVAFERAASSRRYCLMRSQRHCSIPRMRQAMLQRFAGSFYGRVGVGILFIRSVMVLPAQQGKGWERDQHTYRLCV